MRSTFRGVASTTVVPARYPSATRTFARASFWRDHGTSTVDFRAVVAFRMRVRMSAMGSVIMVASPARLHETRDVALPDEVPEAEAAHPEATIERARAAAERAAVVRAHLELGRPRRLHHETGLSHRIRF